MQGSFLHQNRFMRANCDVRKVVLEHIENLEKVNPSISPLENPG